MPVDFQAIPHGWFHLGHSAEYRPGEVHCVERFGGELVVYRTRAGKLVATEPYCPHLGAHLGQGGEVRGECIRCPFHGWEFAVDGSVSSVPGARNIPRRARLATLPTHEVGGLAMVYHGDPAAPVPALTGLELLESNERRHRHSTRITLETNLVEMTENVVDRSHFAVVHPDSFEGVGPYEVTRDENRFSVVTKMRSARGGFEIDFRADLLSAGTATIHTQSPLGDSWVVGLGAPIDERRVDVLLTMLTDRHVVPGLGWLRNRLFLQNVRRGMLQDREIWQRKIRHDRPELSDADGPIMAFRAWFAQFYPECPPEVPGGRVSPGNSREEEGAHAAVRQNLSAPRA